MKGKVSVVDEGQVAVFVSDDSKIGAIGLASNKISSNSEPVAIIGDAIWPVNYATGTRALTLPPVVSFSVDVKSGNAPLAVQFFDLSTNNPTSWNWTFEGGKPSTSTEQNPSVTYSNLGVFQVSLSASNSGGSDIFTKESYITVSDNTGSKDTMKEIVSYYPNPVSEFLRIDCETEFSVGIFNMVGKKLVEVRNQNQIDLSSIDSGFYVIQIEVDGAIIMGKLIKN